MVHIGDTLVSEDVLSEAFCCDLSVCKGNCCNSEGESGAPLDDDELQAMKEVIPIVWDDLTPRGQKTLSEVGPYFKDKAGDWVTTVVEGHDCVFCTYNDTNVDAPLKGACLCAIEKAFREGKFSTLPGYRDGKTPFIKPISCQLYPIRVVQLRNGGQGLNLHRWDICQCAFEKGRREGIRAYQFLREPLIAAYGQDFYEALCAAAEQIIAQE